MKFLERKGVRRFLQISCLLLVLIATYGMYVDYHELSIFSKGIFYFYLFFLFILLVVFIVKLEEFYLSKKPVKDEYLYDAIKRKCSKFPELKEIGNKHIIKLKNGDQRLSVHGMNLINQEYERLSKPIREEKNKKSQKNIDGIVTDLLADNGAPKVKLFCVSNNAPADEEK